MQESEQTSGDVWGKLAAFGESLKLLCQEEELHEKEGKGEKEEGDRIAMQNAVSKAAVNDGRRDTHANAAEDKASA